MNTIKKYLRHGKVFGIRNQILVISTVTCANTVAQKIAYQSACVPITHERGCMEGAKSHQETLAALVAVGKHPNVSGVLIIGLGCESLKAQELAEKISATGQSTCYLSIQEEGGSPETIAKGLQLIEKLKAARSKIVAKSDALGGLTVGVQCGGSDWTTALAGNSVIGAMTDLIIANGGSVLMSEVVGIPGSEHLVAARAVNEKVKKDILSMIQELRAEFIEAHGQRIEEINPTPGNKVGGITTLVEKSMGNIKKMGSAPVQGVLKLGEAVPYSGLWIVDNRVSGPDPINLAGFVMAGAHATVFSTGRGSPVGSPVFPVIKITGNSEAFKKMPSILDFNAGVTLDGLMSVEEAGAELYALLLKVAGGELCKAEINENYEFSIPYTTIL